MTEFEPFQTETVDSSTAPGAPLRVLPNGTRVAGRYIVRERLGTGGFGVVYRVFDEQLQREVALKLLREDKVSPSTLKRFRREVAVARDVENPHLLRLFDLGSDGDAFFITMDLATGRTLEERLDDGVLSIDAALRIGRQMLQGLAALHGAGILHRDIKPENVLFDREGNACLGDFGLALRLDGDETRATIGDGILGTLDYVSPEQARGEDPTIRSDLYSVGMVLFEMLTGQLPFSGESQMARLTARLEHPPREIRSVRPDVPRWLSRFIARLLEQDPRDRYDSAETALRELHRKRISLAGRSRRRRSMVAAVAVLLLTGTLAVWWMNRPRFSHLVARDGVLAGVDQSGKTLWILREKDLGSTTLESASTLATVSRDGPKRLLTLFDGARGFRFGETFHRRVARTMRIRDIETGQVEREVQLPGPPDELRTDFADVYTVGGLEARDLNRDGVDEIIVSFFHKHSYPSYTVIWEPVTNKSRLVYAGSGYQKFMKAIDLDRDGTDELIFAGINNPLGWYESMAAVDLEPPLLADGFNRWATSPDRPYYQMHREPLRWYVLLPRGNPGGLTVTQVRDRPLLTLQYQSGRSEGIDLLGFRTSDASPNLRSDSSARVQARQSAWLHLNAAMQLMRTEIWDEAGKELADAVSRSREAHDALLTEAIQRQEGTRLIRSGFAVAGESLFEKLISAVPTDEAPEIAYDAARALHFSGRLEEAIAWYKRGIGRSPAGKPPEAFVEGEALALVELHRYDEAREALQDFRTALAGRGISGRLSLYAVYADWRQGRVPEFDETQLLGESPVEPIPYWLLEFRHARGESSQKLLEDVDDALDRASLDVSLLLALKAKLLSDEGRISEARGLAQDALDRLSRDIYRSVDVYAQRDVVRDRCDHILHM